MTSALRSNNATAAENLLWLLMGARITHAIVTVARYGIADELARKPKSSAQIARRLHLHPQSLYRLLRALARIELFTEHENRVFKLTDIGRCLLSSELDSHRWGALLQGSDAYESAFRNISKTVKTGESSFSIAHGADLFSYLRRNPVVFEEFNRAMTALSGVTSKAIVEAYDFSRTRLIVDVGGGYGALLGAILQANPLAHGLLFDQPALLDRAAKQLKPAIRERICFCQGDFFARAPAGGDLYLLKNVLHDWPDRKAQVILRRCNRAMSAGAKLLIIESMLGVATRLPIAEWMDLTMLALLPAGARERTELEYRRLLQADGFKVQRVIATSSLVQIIEATKPRC